jgi:hypothetical protein
MATRLWREAAFAETGAARFSRVRTRANNYIDLAQLHHPLFFNPRPIGFANKPLSVSCLASTNRAVIVAL